MIPPPPPPDEPELEPVERQPAAVAMTATAISRANFHERFIRAILSFVWRERRPNGIVTRRRRIACGNTHAFGYRDPEPSPRDPLPAGGNMAGDRVPEPSDGAYVGLAGT